MATKGRKPKLTDKEELFCDFYTNHSNGTKAVKQAGYEVKNDNVAGVLAFRLLRKAKIQKRVRKLRKQKAKALGIDNNYILQKFANIANANIVDVLKQTNGKLTLQNLEKLPVQIQQQIKTVKLSAKGDLSVTIHDPANATDKLAKHTGFFEKHNQQKGEASRPIIKFAGNKGNNAK